jgi:hypothetical protein
MQVDRCAYIILQACNHLWSEWFMEDLVAHVLSRCQSPQERGRAASITAHIFLGVGKTCRDQTSSSVKLEVCCHSAVVWSLLFHVPGVVLPSVSFSFARPVCL